MVTVSLMNTRIFSIPAALTVAAFALSGCAQSPDKAAEPTSSAPTSNQVKVVASFYPLVYLTKQIGGNHVAITNLTPSGEAHDAELSASQIDDVAHANVVIYEKDFQPSVDDAVAKTKPKNVVDVAEHVDLVPMEKHESSVDETAGHDHEAEGHDHEAESHEAEGHDHEGEGHDHAEHNHGSKDPHFWLNPALYAEAITPIVDALSKADSAHAADYKANAEKLRASLKELDGKYKKALTNCKVPTVVVAHEAYGYMADRYGFTQVGVTGINPEQETSAKRLEAVAKVAKDNKVTTLFSESALNAKDAKTLAEQLGITTKVLDPLETQTNKDKDYMAVMDSNLANLAEAMQCTQAK